MSEEETAPEERELRNTLYRRLTRGQRKLTRGRMLVYRIAVFVGWGLLRFFWNTCRLMPVARPGRRARDAACAPFGDPRLLASAHLFGIQALRLLEPHGLTPGFLITPSVDGTAPAMLARRIGGHVIRGSSTHTGARALRDFYEAIVKQQVSPAITPDGPRGPVHEFKQGAVVLAQLTGKPILPIAVSASRTLRFSTWDRFELPVPFSRVADIDRRSRHRAARIRRPTHSRGCRRSSATTLLALKASGYAALGKRAG